MMVQVSSSPRNEFNIPTNVGAVCVQQYIKSPLLINGSKFDIRVYVLLTSLDPLCVYLYEDGLVRIATERYTENPRSVKDNCIHITNFRVNVDNENKFVSNKNVSDCQGHKWRLKCLWKFLHSNGVQQHELERIWSQMEDAVIKSILCSYSDMQEDFKKLTSNSIYNTYKLLGYDLLLDSSLKLHLIEINARPALLDDTLDSIVNRPMVEEMMRIVGFHIPALEEAKANDIIKRMLTRKNAKWGKKLIYDPLIYCRQFDDFNSAKIERFQSKISYRQEYVHTILDGIENVTSMDIKILIKLEEELNQCRQFIRIFPSVYGDAACQQNESVPHYKYFRYMDEISYNDKLLDAFLHKFGGSKEKRLDFINRHLSVLV